ncbi:MAG: MDR family MFS transporter [Bacteroidota bacterium]|nr:MDR family MFS transporter [Bacteroidota bacterium]
MESLVYAVKPERRARLTTGVILGVLLVALEGTVVATAMPRVIRDLGGAELYSLPFTFYLLSMTLSGPLWGRLSDLWGRRTPYCWAVGLFLLGSALSGASWDMMTLIAARTLQGLGAGGVQTLNLTLIGECYPMAERARMQAYISVVWGLSSAIGPLAGGLITDVLSWRAVFWLALPVGVAALSLVGSAYPRSAGYRRGSRLDVPGALWFACSGAMLLYGLERHLWGLTGAAAALLLMLPCIEAHQPVPLVPVHAFRDRFLRGSLLGNYLGGMAFFGAVAFIPLWGQVALGRSAAEAGLLLTPLSGGWTLSGALAARWLPRWGAVRLVRLGAALIVIGFSAWAALSRAPFGVQMLCGILIGAGMGQVMIALLISTQEAARRDELGVITALVFFARNVGGAMGTALMSALLGQALFEVRHLLERFPLLLAFAACLGLLLWGVSGSLQGPATNARAPDPEQAPQGATGSRAPNAANAPHLPNAESRPAPAPDRGPIEAP